MPIEIRPNVRAWGCGTQCLPEPHRARTGADAFNQQNGLVYIPTFNMCMDIASKDEEYTPGKFYLASEFNLDMAGSSAQTCREFIAWDPVAGKKVWYQGGSAVPGAP